MIYRYYKEHVNATRKDCRIFISAKLTILHDYIGKQILKTSCRTRRRVDSMAEGIKAIAVKKGAR